MRCTGPACWCPRASLVRVSGGALDPRAGRFPAALLLATLSLFCLLPAGASAGPAARAGRSCRAPSLRGLTLALARKRAARVGCAVRLAGAKLEQATIQTVGRQSPAPEGRAPHLTLWLNPLCAGSAAYAPDVEEPSVTAGPTEILSGFYVDGGPLVRFSAPHCRRPEPKSEGGTVEVLDAQGAVVATATAPEGALVAIALAPGTYTLRGMSPDESLNDLHPRPTQPITVRAGYTIRQDFFLDVP